MTRTIRTPLYQATICRCNLTPEPLAEPVADIDELCPYCDRLTRHLTGPVVGWTTREEEVREIAPVVIGDVHDYVCRDCEDTGYVTDRDTDVRGDYTSHNSYPCPACRGRRIAS